MTNCNICGQPMIQLRGWDFKLDVCLNHDPPHFISQDWLHEPKYKNRALEGWEVKEIDKRAWALKQRLTVVKTPKEIWAVVLGFLSGGWNPEIDERITKEKGEHL